MQAVFLKILNMSITASWLVLAVLFMRLILKKAPKFLSVIMWALVGIRLVLPFSFESVLSLIPSAETVPPEILYEHSPQVQTGFDTFDSAINPAISESFAPAPGASVNPVQVVAWLAGWIWVIGIVAMAIYTLISCLRIRRKLREAAPLQDNIYVCDRIDTPFIFGLFQPRIYLPSGIAAEDIPYVLAHEQAHLKRKDHLWKPLGFLLLTIYWFNPLLWLAYILLCRDIETACDEKVLKDMGEAVKKPYSNALVNCSIPRKMIAACPLAFGEINIKSRIKKVLHYKKPAFWLLITATAACIVLSVCFLTNPRTVNEKMQIFLDCQIAEHHQSEKSAGHACCVDYEILGVKKSGRTTTVYMWVLYEEYSYQNGQLKDETGSHTPTVITATKIDGNYRLAEYWTPRDGTYYPEDIKDKFPWYLHLKALDSQRYIKRQQKACRELAERYFEENPPSPQTDPTLPPPETHAAPTSLQKHYPEYFGLPTDQGLKVVVWQMAPGRYNWGLLPGRDAEHTWEDYLKLEPVSMEDVRAIVESYELSPSQVSVELIHMPYSSYFNPMHEQAQKSVESIFWGNLSIELTYVGNSWSAVTIDDPQICGYLLDWLFLAESYSQQSGSSAGYYGAPYSMDIYWDRQSEPFSFTLWDENTYSVSTHKDSDGYEYFYKADLSELYAYLEKNYPADVWFLRKDEVTFSYAGGNRDQLDALCENALNKNMLYLSNARHLPIYKFDTLEELEQFKRKYPIYDTGWDKVPSFNAVTAQYDEDFFDSHTLMLVYIPSGNRTHRFDVAYIDQAPPDFGIVIQQTTGTKDSDDANACWFITYAIPDELAESCTQFDATLGDM